MHRLAVATTLVTFAALAACSREGSVPTETSAPAPEANLALSLAGTADSAARAGGSTMDLLLQAVRTALAQQDNPRARALLDQSRALADSGRAAAQARHPEAARRYFEAAHDALCRGIVLVLPNAARRIGAQVDTIRARMLVRLDTVAAPRIRAVLGFVADLRGQSDSAAATGDPAKALGLNVRAMDTLRALQQHLQHPGGPGLPGDPGAGPPPDGGGLPPPPPGGNPPPGGQRPGGG
jgi:hypothetical protein